MKKNIILIGFLLLVFILKAQCPENWSMTNEGNKLKTINGYGWGIAPDNSVWKFENNKWVSKNSGNKLKAIYGYDWGIAPDNSVWRWEHNKWVSKNPSNKLKAIYGYGWGIAPDNSVWKFENNKWVSKNSGNKLIKLFIHFPNTWGIAPDDTVWKWDKKSNKWIKTPTNGKFKDITSINNGLVNFENSAFAIDSNGDLWNYLNSQWRKCEIPNGINFSSIHYGDVQEDNKSCRIFAVDSNNQVWSSIIKCKVNTLY